MNSATVFPTQCGPARPAENMPTASFAGQQDPYLNIAGTGAVLKQVKRCWASRFSQRAVSYRIRIGFDHTKMSMPVIVQQVVAAQASGIVFTADPVTSGRKVVSVEAALGLGEALVSGLVNAGIYEVRDGETVSTAIATKRLAIRALPASGPPAGTNRELGAC